MKIDDIFREMEELQKKLADDMFRDFDDLEEMVKSGKLEGDWRFEPIERPGMKGFIARGYFSTPSPLERPTDILPPLRPKLREPREPLYDISVGEDELTLFIELPGVEEKDINLEVTDGKLSVEAKDFKTEIDLSGWVLKTDEMKKEYRNGVIKVVIPKIGLDEQLI
jgi:HSP20 family molecular chaperone IbpA